MGMEQAGWSCKFQVEWDKDCLSILDHHWADVPKLGDIREVDGRLLPPVDCIIFGSPCQDLSNQPLAGTRTGLSGKRSGLFYEAIRIIEEMRDATGNVSPRWAIWENVAGALDSNGGADFGEVLDSLAQSGALVIEWKLLDTKYFGIPQTRRRVFVVARYNSDSSESSSSQVFPIFKSGSRDIKKGTDVLFYRSHGKFDQFSVGYSPPCKTITSICITSETLKPRSLTPLECERLQGYPDDHTRWGAKGVEQSDTRRYRQIGNGVTTPVAKWVGQQVLRVHKQLYDTLK